MGRMGRMTHKENSSSIQMRFGSRNGVKNRQRQVIKSEKYQEVIESI